MIFKHFTFELLFLACHKQFDQKAIFFAIF